MIRKANRSDCINLAALSLEVWLRTYCVDGIRSENSKFAIAAFTEDAFAKILADSSRQLVVYTEGMYLRGHVLINLESHCQGEEHGFEIEKLYVHEVFQRQGVGQKLLQEVIARYGSSFWLYTWERNSSLEFYKLFGCKDIGQYDFELGGDIIKNRILTYSER
jgi:ribosomal protein S18 acetylase RimI-like enzyme